MDTLNEIAYGLAAAQAVGFNDDITDYYQGYLLIVDAVGAGLNPPAYIWEPLENWPWDTVLSHIDDEAVSIGQALNGTLELAKAGMVKAAMSGMLDLDLNNLDMRAMVDLGAAE